MPQIESTTLERWEFLVKARQNPTGTAPAFAVDLDNEGEPTNWVNGSWDSTWDPVTGRVTALSPRMGKTGDLVLTPDTTVTLWARWAAGDELKVRRAALLEVS